MSKVPFDARRSDCLWLDPEELMIITDKNHPLYDPRAMLPVDESLIANILFEMQGVLEPIIVAKDEDGHPIVVDGRQRTKALREANKRLKAQGASPLQMPFIYKRGNGTDLFAISISLNEQRIQDGPKEKAEKLKRLLNQGYNLKQAADVFGVSVGTIRNWESLLNTSETHEEKVIARKKPSTPKTRKKLRSRKEITERLANSEGIEAEVLRWVLNEGE